MSPSGRHIQIDSIPNFRDFGGYAGADGRVVRWGALYRSSAVSDVPASDFEHLSGLGLSLVCDLRTHDERSRAPNALDGHDLTEVLTLDIGGRERMSGVPATPLLTNPEATGQDAYDRMQGSYAAMVVDYADRFALILHRLLNGGQAPVLIHCAAGKDRTGIAAAIILLALGVPIETVVEDYLLTNGHLNLDWRARMLAQMFPDNPSINTKVADVMFKADADFLLAAIDSIDRTFGSFDVYLSDALSIGPRDLRTLHDLFLD